MNSNPNILMQSLVQATLQNLAADYARQGYQVEMEKELEGIRADLVATKGDEVVVFEVKAGHWTPDKREQVTKLKELVSRLPRGQFKLLFVEPPPRKMIEVEDLDKKLLDVLTEDQDKLSAKGAWRAIEDVYHLASHVRFDEITDLEIEHMTVRSGGLEARGRGFLSVDLQYGSGPDQETGKGLILDDTFPFTFSLLLDGDGNIKEVLTLNIDVSSFTGE